MSLQAVVQPQWSFPDGTPVTLTALRLAAQPIVNLIGAVDASSIPDLSLANVKFANNNIDLSQKALDLSLTTGKMAEGCVTAPKVMPDAYFYADATLTAGIYGFAPTPAIAAYAAGQRFYFKADVTNKGATDVNINSIGAANLFKNVSQELGVGDIVAGQIVGIQYDGTNFQLLGGTPTYPPATPVAGGTKNLVINNRRRNWIKTLTRSTTTVTVTTYVAHGLTTGDKVMISGSDQPLYNVSDTTVTVSTATVFTYTLGGGTPVSPGTGLMMVSSKNIDITADEVAMKNSDGLFYKATAVNVAVNILAASGAQGALDTGMIAPSTWYYVWLVYNTQTVFAVTSTSATAPTLTWDVDSTPAVWPHFTAMVGAFYVGTNSDALPYVVPFAAQGNRTVTAPQSVMTLTAPATTGLLQTLSLANFVPPMAKRVFGLMGVATNADARILVAPDLTMMGEQRFNAGATAALVLSPDGFQACTAFTCALLTAQSLAWTSLLATANNQISVTGYEI